MLLAVACPIAVVAALVPVRDHVENTNLALGLVVVVLLVAVIAGRRAGIIAALSASVAFDFVLTRPFYSLRITSSNDLQTTALLDVIGVVAASS
jgi:K+-sensing histidine kinase KdpD